MGVVWSARQRSLDRVVAVKRVRADATDAVKRSLVGEALILGALEHPHIVPVHLLGADADGASALVMKRVEGVEWRALLADPEHPFGAAASGGAPRPAGVDNGGGSKPPPDRWLRSVRTPPT